MRALIRLVRDLPASLRTLARQRGRELRAEVWQGRAEQDRIELTILEELGPDYVARYQRDRQNTARWQYEEVMLRWADLLDPERTDGS